MNRLNHNLIATAIVVSTSFGGGAVAHNPGKTWMQYATPEEAGFSSGKLKSVEDLYERNAASAFLVVYDGNVLLSKGDITRRYDTHSMRFQIFGSSSKTWTSMPISSSKMAGLFMTGLNNRISVSVGSDRNRYNTKTLVVESDRHRNPDGTYSKGREGRCPENNEEIPS